MCSTSDLLFVMISTAAITTLLVAILYRHHDRHRAPQVIYIPPPTSTPENQNYSPWTIFVILTLVVVLIFSVSFR